MEYALLCFGEEVNFYQTVYHSLTQHPIILSGKWLVGHSCVIMQDNDPRHSRKLWERYIKTTINIMSFNLCLNWCSQHLLTMLTWNRRDSTTLSAAPRAPKGSVAQRIEVPGEHCQKIAVSIPIQAGQRFTWSKMWCDRQQLWKAVITGDTVTRLSIPIRCRS